jgi:hypothetical protein
MTPHLRPSRASLAARAIAVLAAAAFLAAGVASASGLRLPSGDDEQGRVVRVTEEPARTAEIRRLIETRDAREGEARAPERAPAPRSGGEADRRDEGEADRRDEGADAPEASETEDAPEGSEGSDAPEAQPETIPEGDVGASGDEGDG